ncbi:hypothetical protein [Variovorax fucosicus]|uniref:hypothetical protein n=1 Tax=Variovorax fucosicus TaxID=3053517 RepID=UPI002575D551|nr:hypothetical protein [Variovorax sp. J22G47]MDM0056697.1 hypothetical protein [Variovorax sp. J22G47]
MTDAVQRSGALMPIGQEGGLGHCQIESTPICSPVDVGPQRVETARDSLILQEVTDALGALHGFGDNACGSLSWASLNKPVEGGDWVGCARALCSHGLPPARPDPSGSDIVLIGEKRYQFADDVTDVLFGARAEPGTID